MSETLTKDYDAYFEATQRYLDARFDFIVRKLGLKTVKWAEDEAAPLKQALTASATGNKVLLPMVSTHLSDLETYASLAEVEHYYDERARRHFGRIEGYGLDVIDWQGLVLTAPIIGDQRPYMLCKALYIRGENGQIALSKVQRSIHTERNEAHQSSEPVEAGDEAVLVKAVAQIDRITDILSDRVVNL